MSHQLTPAMGNQVTFYSQSGQRTSGFISGIIRRGLSGQPDQFRINTGDRITTRPAGTFTIKT